eukprot:6480493-Amphidinium_carterae.4
MRKVVDTHQVEVVKAKRRVQVELGAVTQPLLLGNQAIAWRSSLEAAERHALDLVKPLTRNDGSQGVFLIILLELLREQHMELTLVFHVSELVVNRPLAVGLIRQGVPEDNALENGPMIGPMQGRVMGPGEGGA